MERLIDQVRRQLVDASMVARCVPADEQAQTFQVLVESKANVSSSLPAGIDCSIRPVSLAPSLGMRFAAIDHHIATFKSLAFESLTAFFAIAVRARAVDRELSKEFVLKLPLIGEPADRDARLLLAMLSNRERLLRYLFMLLDDSGFGARGGAGGGWESWGESAALGSFGLPLLEPMLRTLAEDPARLDHVERLVADLEQTEQGRKMLPDELATLWTAIRLTKKSHTAAAGSASGTD
ncbi:MAG: hypothetical protein ACRELV_15290 [Longimicrobiales bacterium]